ncbi:hypothetical protein HHX47_DHR1000451 [Lentinula edodes]|nr:hypothetical protein HHX47_DHR1000451 [Lentinula edodes]
MFCSKTVFRCFKTLERLGDRVTGAAGPFFVGLAVILISAGTICFFDVVMPSLAYPWLGGPICLLIAFNLLVHYYLVVTTNPGFVEDLPRGAGKGFLWATPRNMSKERPLTEGVRWSTELNVTKAELTKCRKCGQQKPEAFVNSYDLGPFYTLIFPFRILPYTDGRSWARREGLSRHRGIRMGEELTDEEDL